MPYATTIFFLYFALVNSSSLTQSGVILQLSTQYCSLYQGVVRCTCLIGGQKVAYKIIPLMRLLLPISQCGLLCKLWGFLGCCPSNLPCSPRPDDFTFVLFCLRKVCTEAHLFPFGGTVYLL
jgi:hypothetical protein